MEGVSAMKIVIRLIASIFSAFVSLILWGIISGEMFDDGLYDYSSRDYLASYWSDLDITVLICLGIFIISLLFIWKLFKKKWRLIAAGSIALLVIYGALYNTNQKNMLEIREIGSSMEEVDLRAYEPFRENTLAKSLDEISSLHLDNNLPRLDGATALYPLYAAFARATYPEAQYNLYSHGNYDDCLIHCSRTSGAFEKLIEGKADIIFLAGVSKELRVMAQECGLELKLTPIGREAFVFFVNKRNSMTNLSVENILGIYSGQITNWCEVGGSNRKILAYQRPETSGSQIMLKEIMGDTPIMEAPEKDTYDLMMEMYKAVAYKNHKNALGYSFLYYIRDMIAENEIKFLAINGIEPNAANIANGTYPYAHDFYAITVVREYETEEERLRAENAEILVEWILSPQGQSLVEKTGYVSLPR